MDISFNFRLYKCYLPVAVNRERKEWRCCYETLHKRVAESKAEDMRPRYKKEEGWEVSIQKEIVLILGNREKRWTTKLFNIPEEWRQLRRPISNPIIPARLVKFESSI